MPVVNAPASATSSSLIVRFAVSGKEAFAPASQTPGGPLQWGRNSGGRNVWAFSPDKAEALRHKVVEYTPIDWGKFTDAGGNTAAPIGASPKAAPKAAPKAPAAKAAPKAAPAEPGHRSAAQCRATLALCASNLAKCQKGVIGGDIERYGRAEETAFVSFSEALQREGASRAVAEEAAKAVAEEAAKAVRLAA
jgi:hypothetical protein